MFFCDTGELRASAERRAPETGRLLACQRNSQPHSSNWRHRRFGCTTGALHGVGRPPPAVHLHGGGRAVVRHRSEHGAVLAREHRPPAAIAVSARRAHRHSLRGEPGARSVRASGFSGPSGRLEHMEPGFRCGLRQHVRQRHRLERCGAAALRRPPGGAALLRRVRDAATHGSNLYSRRGAVWWTAGCGHQRRPVGAPLPARSRGHRPAPVARRRGLHHRRRDAEGLRAGRHRSMAAHRVSRQECSASATRAF